MNIPLKFTSHIDHAMAAATYAEALQSGVK